MTLPSDQRTDEELVRAYRESADLQVLATLYTRYTSLVYGTSLKYLKDRDDARDAVMQLYEKLATTLLDHPVDNFRSWLYVTCRNHCLMQLRAAKRAPKQEISPFLMESGLAAHPEPDLRLEEDLSRLEKCMETLVQEQQQCVRMFYLDQKSYAEVSATTGYELNQVKSYIQNGKRNLKICMESNGS